MKCKFLLLLITTIMSMSVVGQNTKTLLPGYPDRSPKMNVLPGFKNPPKGYGEVAFYWWVGDTLTKERLLWELDQLKEKNITGLQINYCHTDKGGATYGLTYPSQPALFSDKWWELVQWFLKEAKKRGMSISLSDYTLGAAGQGWYVDEVLKENPQLNGSKLEAKYLDIPGNQDLKTTISDNIITATAYQNDNGKLLPSTAINLKPFIKNTMLNWKAPSGNWKVVLVNKKTIKTSFDPMNPLSGKKIAEKFYQRFEDHCPGESGKGLNYFFSDELQFGIRGFLWNDAFAAAFKKRKGYDITPELPSLFTDLGPRSYKIRLDYNDVMVSLTEDGFFKPVYNWHNSRGMLFGCDHGGRGKDVTEFGDYFRTQRWLSGPGCDQPNLGKDIVKAKVASSITHMYERPRTWLEGYYGSGWGTSSAEVADATFTDFAMGHNLLSLHALYYSTHGSWWEWAAPDNHFRQPYWSNMGDFLKCVERLSYILSQGYHRCDVAMIYPVAPVEANLKGKESIETAFAIANDLYPAGIDFDFMDFESLNRCQMINKELKVSGEKYKVLILPALSAVRYSTIEKALAFYKSGGIVLAVGSLPEVSDRVGGNDVKLQSMIKEMFGITYAEKDDITKNYSQKNSAGGLGMYIHNPLEVKKVIDNLIQPDFKVLSENSTSNILHRKIGTRDVYFVYGVPKGTECFFRSNGKVELWNPWNGTLEPLKVSSVSKIGTKIHLPLEKEEPQLIVFSQGIPEIENLSTESLQKRDTIKIDNNWEFELKPTLDNKFGDYRLPAFNGKIGAEVWKMKYADAATTDQNWQNPNLDDSSWGTASVSYGPQFLKLGPLPVNMDSTALETKLSALKQIDLMQPVEINGIQYFWKPYEFSWRWGLKDDAGHQGYHGLKGHVNNELISFGKIDKTNKHMPVFPLKVETEGSVYYLWTNISLSQQMQSKINKAGLLPTKFFLNNRLVDANTQVVDLNSGSNSVLLKYNNVGRGYFIFEKSHIDSIWQQTNSLATQWYLNPNILSFDCYPQLDKKFGWYRFMTPPGASSMFVQSVTKPKVWIGGIEFSCQTTKPDSERFINTAIPLWKIVFPETIKTSSLVAMKIEQQSGYYGGATIPEPVLFECTKGEIILGDLKDNESLKTYSGAMWYRKTLNITNKQSIKKSITLDLGSVVSSAEVFINGKPIGMKLSAPWTFNLSGKLKVGENRIEILIYNTMGNHYLNTPSMYIGRINSGLIGPVKILFSSFTESPN
ncbi:MAG: hypothetical protein HXX14_14615 [Bacteroidetes bacterium]|nr:hypothetical protein [Bacteroidota bacterium]